MDKAGKLFLPDSASVVIKIDGILRAVRESGYLLAEIDKVEWSKHEVTAFINPRQRFSLSKLSSGNVPENFLNEAGYSERTLKTASFSSRKIEQLFQDLLKVYVNNGYPFAVLSLDSVRIDSSTVKASLRAEAGTLVVFDTLQVAGDIKISRKYLESFLGMKEGNVFNQRSLDEVSKSLADLSFIRSVKMPEVKFVGGRAKVTLFLEKQPANQFDGVLGFLPGNNTGKLQLVGDLKLHLQNPLKRAEQLDFNYRGLPEKSKELNLGLQLSELFSTPLGLELGLNLYKQSASYQNVSAGASLNYRIPKGRFSLLFRNRSGLPVGTDSLESTALSFANTNAISYGGGLLYRTVNSMVGATRGVYIDISAESGRRHVSAPPAELAGINLNNRQFRINSRMEFYRPVGTKSIFKFNNETGVLFGKNLFQNELYRIGGFNSLKGFNEQSLPASSFTYFNAEYRLMIENTSYLFAFFNQAFLKSRTVSTSMEDTPLGFGAGINLKVKTGMFSLSYALGKQKDNPLNLQSGKIHFGLITLF